MKKQILICLIGLLLFRFSYAQTGKSHITLSIGPSLPVGDFGGKDISDNSSGLAKLGQVANFTYAKLLGKRWGLSATLHGQRNPLNISSIEKTLSGTAFSQGFFMGSSTNQPIPPGTYAVYPNWNFEKKSWLMGSLLLGCYGELPFNKDSKLLFIPKIGLGATYVSSPQLNGSSITDTVAAHLMQSGSNAFGFAWSVGGGLQYSCGKKCFFVTSLEYLGTNKMRFKDITATFTTTRGSFGSPDYSIQQTRVAGEVRQTISSINLLVGLGIRL